jgi:pilus assembly protein Flp/PilA
MSPATPLVHRAVQCGVRLFRALLAWLRQPALGQGLVEYSMILLLIAVVVVGAVTLFGARVSTLYSQVDCKVEGAVEHHTSVNCP